MKFIKFLVVLILVTLSFALIFNQSLANLFASRLSDQYYKEVKVVALKESTNYNKSLYDPNNISALSSVDVFQSTIEHKFDHLNAHAKIVIPSIDMNLPVFLGLTNENLMVGAGTMKPNQELGSGNYALASHSVFSGYGKDDMLFTSLHRVKTSTSIYVIKNNQSFRYKITDIFEVDPDAGYVIDDVPGENLITLVTCTDMEATRRLIVQGRFVEEVSVNDLSDAIKQFL